MSEYIEQAQRVLDMDPDVDGSTYLENSQYAQVLATLAVAENLAEINKNLNSIKTRMPR